MPSFNYVKVTICIQGILNNNQNFYILLFFSFRVRNTNEELDEVQSSPIHEWLDSIKMGKYASNFADVGYRRLSQIANLTEQDLSDMGITLVGHRHKIHQSIPLVAS